MDNPQYELMMHLLDENKGLKDTVRKCTGGKKFCDICDGLIEKLGDDKKNNMEEIEKIMDKHFSQPHHENINELGG